MRMIDPKMDEFSEPRLALFRDGDPDRADKDGKCDGVVTYCLDKRP